MDIKEVYKNLPTFIRKKVEYTAIRNYLFAGGNFPKELQEMIDKETPGWGEVVCLKETLKVVREYGCMNESELKERGNIELALAHHLLGPQSIFPRTTWQVRKLN